METAEMGRVLTEVTIYNWYDEFEFRKGRLPLEKVRKVVVPNAVVDTKITTLALPKSFIDQLGLTCCNEKRCMTAGGPRITGSYDAVRLEIMGRDATVEPYEVPEGNPVLIGHTPLTLMDWVVDTQNHKLIGNPEHGGEHILELYNTFVPGPH